MGRHQLLLNDELEEKIGIYKERLGLKSNTQTIKHIVVAYLFEHEECSECGHSLMPRKG